MPSADGPDQATYFFRENGHWTHAHMGRANARSSRGLSREISRKRSLEGTAPGILCHCILNYSQAGSGELTFSRRPDSTGQVNLLNLSQSSCGLFSGRHAPHALLLLTCE